MALFRNLSVYSLPGGWAVSLPQLVGMLEQHQFVPTTDLQAESTGWAPVHEGYGLVHEVQGHLLLRQRTESRVMPAKAIELQVREAAAKVEEAQGYKPGKKQRKEIREQVIDQMLPAAFRQQDDVLVWIDTHAGRLGIDSASSGPRDAAVALLCESIDHFALDRLSVRTAAAGAMTAWLADDEVPEGFTIDTLADLRAAGEGAGAVQYVNRPLDPQEVRHHIQSGMQCTRLALTWQDRISFVLDDELVLKRIVPADVVQMDVERSAKTEAEEFEADFFLMATTLRGLVADLVDALGGEYVDDRQADMFRTSTGPALRADDTDDDGDDPLLAEARRVVVENRRASISLVQRHLRIGYNRAASLLEALEERGVVTAMRPDGGRELLAIS